MNSLNYGYNTGFIGVRVSSLVLVKEQFVISKLSLKYENREIPELCIMYS